jgi:hypothetical protein
LTAVIPDFIQIAEEDLGEDKRVRSLYWRETFSVSAEQVALPSDCRQVQQVYHDGSTYYGPIEIVPAHILAQKKLDINTSGYPRFAAILPADAKIQFSPVPDDTYTLHMLYERKITPLSDTNTTNWFLDDHAGIYLAAAMVEAYRYLKDAENMNQWFVSLDAKLNKLYANAQRREFSGHMVARPRRAIG